MSLGRLSRAAGAVVRGLSSVGGRAASNFAKVVTEVPVHLRGLGQRNNSTVNNLALLEKSSTYVEHKHNNYSRDERQRSGGKPPLAATVEYNKFYNELRKKYPDIFGIYEVGGASDQNAALAHLLPLGEFKELSKQLPDTDVRSLFRLGAGPGIVPAHTEVIKEFVGLRAYVWCKDSQRKFIIKGFHPHLIDDPKYWESTIEAIKEQQKLYGDRVQLEVALPVFFDQELEKLEKEGKDKNPYTHEYYLNKLEKALEIVTKSGLLPGTISASFKDFAGTCKPHHIKGLAQATQDILNKYGIKSFGFHGHDHGFGKETQEEFLRSFAKSGLKLNADYVAVPGTGFNHINIDELVKAYHQYPELRQDLLKYKELEEKEVIPHLNKSPYSFEEILHGRIPGGGEGALLSMAGTAKVHVGDKSLHIYEALGLSQDEFLNILPHQLRAVAPFYGNVVPVTPGFAYLQLEAFRALKFGIENGYFAKCLGNKDAIINKIANMKNAPEEYLEKFFKDITLNMQRFVSAGGMPSKVHPFAENSIAKFKETRASEVVHNDLPNIYKEIEALRKEGKVQDWMEKDALVDFAIVLGFSALRGMAYHPSGKNMLSLMCERYVPEEARRDMNSAAEYSVLQDLLSHFEAKQKVSDKSTDKKPDNSLVEASTGSSVLAGLEVNTLGG